MKHKWPLLNEPDSASDGAFLWMVASAFGVIFTFGTIIYAASGDVVTAVLSALGAVLAFALAAWA